MSYFVCDFVRRMPFTEAVLTECQRMWVVTPIIGPRRVLADTTLGGYTIRKNTTVLMNIFANNMDPKLYPDPTSFKPERFFKDSAYQSDDHVVTFGKGESFINCSKIALSYRRAIRCQYIPRTVVI